MKRCLKRALLSVSDKTGLVELAQDLRGRGVELLSTGGTFKVLKRAGLEVTEVASYTGFPEMMDGRVKTLHPKIHGGILGRRDEDQSVMQQHRIDAIDLVVVNLYPFQATIAQPNCSFKEAVENIDIGGPAMIRSAAKNHNDVLVLVDPADYSALQLELSRNDGCTGYDFRYRYAAKAFRHTADYDNSVANYLASDLPGAQKSEEGSTDTMPQSLVLSFEKLQELRYGENPHQKAAFYRDIRLPQVGVITSADQLQGKALSYNNLADSDAAVECVRIFSEPACVIVKHANPCGVGLGSSLQEAYDRAYATDPTSAFGGIIAFNRSLDGDLMKKILAQQFVEVVIAPEINPSGVEAAKQKKNVRLLRIGSLSRVERGLELKRVSGGLLAQQADDICLAEKGLHCVTQREVTDSERRDLLFAWQVAWFVKSNAIVYARNQQTIGIGAGQMSRVISARIAAMKARDEGLDVAGAVMASDAFFPFRDGVDAAADAGITAVIQPGGSMRDAEVIAAANEHGMAMMFTGIRHFRH